MTSKDRVFRQLRGENIDHIPLMGGWFQGVGNLAALAGLSVRDYCIDPVANLFRANRALHIDCMVAPPMVPTEGDQVFGRTLDELFEPENLKQAAEALPDLECELIAAINPAQIESTWRALFTRWMQAMGDIVLIPTCFESVPNFMMYQQYGYEAYLMAIALYPEAVGKLYWRSAVEARIRNTIFVKLIREFALPPVLFTGHDICNNTGPMCSLEFLRRYYFPQERYALMPLVDAGIRVVRHCDGNVMPIIDDSIGVGYSGFQGFQYECGVDPFAIARRVRGQGERLLFFAGMNVTRTLPFGTIEDVRREIEYVLDFTDRGQGLFFFSSSSIGPEVPLENVRYACEYIAGGQYAERVLRTGRHEWPGFKNIKK